VHGPVDQLSISNPIPNLGGKIGIDATRKRPDEDFPRPWPAEIRMDPSVVARIDQLVARVPALSFLRDVRPP
jgi:4-hydroxy-3-polyprenylbenzoate decarboxylase